MIDLTNRRIQIFLGMVLCIVLVYFLPQLIWSQDTVMKLLIVHILSSDYVFQNRGDALSARLIIVGCCIVFSLFSGVLIYQKHKYIAGTLWVMILPLAYVLLVLEIQPMTLSSRVRPTGQYFINDFDVEKKTTPYYLTVNSYNWSKD